MGLRISSAEIADSSSRHALLHAHRLGALVSPNTAASALQSGDVLAICDNDLHDSMSDSEIAAIAS